MLATDESRVFSKQRKEHNLHTRQQHGDLACSWISLLPCDVRYSAKRLCYAGFDVYYALLDAGFGTDPKDLEKTTFPNGWISHQPLL
jgi:hypothetical protein